MMRILEAQDTQKRIASKQDFLHHLYSIESFEKIISKLKEFSIFLMKRYETVLDNINSHSYAK